MFVENNSKCKLISKEYKNSVTNLKFMCECGNIFETSWSRFKNYNKRKCNKCSIKIRISKISGKNNVKYNINKTDEERKDGRHYPEYNNWIKKVFARDNYKCVCCGKKSREISAHHLDGYNWCKEKRTDETNGVTLCETCHKNFHSIYGYGDNTKEQFEKWIGHTIEVLKYEGKLSAVRKIKDLTTNEIYNSVDECADVLEIKSKIQIYDVCNKKKRKEGKYERIRKTAKGHRLIWLDEYIKSQIQN